MTLSIFDSIGDFFGDVGSMIGDAISDAFSYVGDIIVTALKNFFGQVLYLIDKILCEIVHLLYRFFGVFSGMDKIVYDGESTYLVNVFFGNKSINNVYWGMALIGFALIIAFTLIAVIRKSFDLFGKQQRSLGNIIYTAVRSIIVIMLLSAVMSASLNVTNVLMESVIKIFDEAESLDKKLEMDFTDEQYATMARILNTIGNYSLNTSAESRFNLNSCYNAIRPDLKQLQDEGVFDFYYDDKNGTEVTWQSMLQEVVQAHDVRYEMKLDDVNVVAPLQKIMYVLKTSRSFYPISHISRNYVTVKTTVPIDVVIFLSGTFGAADNKSLDIDPGINDSLRGPFYSGDKSIYDFDEVDSVFDTAIGGISYLIIGIMAVLTMKNLTICIFNFISRIVNLLGLYVVAPPIIATSVLDDGEKFKQWVTATVIQVFGIFGNIIPMRLVILFVPIIFDSELVFFPDSSILNMLAKALMLVAGIETANKFSNLFNGILSGMAGRESASSNLTGMATGAVAAAGGFVAGATGVAGANKFISKTAQKISDKGGAVIGTARVLFGKDDKDKKDKDGDGDGDGEKAKDPPKQVKRK